MNPFNTNRSMYGVFQVLLARVERCACCLEDGSHGVVADGVADGAAVAELLGEVAADVAEGFQLAQHLPEAGGVDALSSFREGVHDLPVEQRLRVRGEDGEDSQALLASGELPEAGDPVV